MNSNQMRFLRNLLESEKGKKLVFKVKGKVDVICATTDETEMDSVGLDDIETIHKGSNELYNSLKWSCRPPYTCEIQYNGYLYRTFITSFGPNHISSDPELIVVIKDFKGRIICKKDVYQIVRDYMKGNNLTSKRRILFENEFYRAVDHCIRFDIKALVREAVINANI